jgi:3-deoxy-manno-octulosonate cytidylyltransferase (CMP-KDO synthetase)
MNEQKITIIIPARYESNRLPGKILMDIVGKTMIQRVYEQCIKSGITQDIIVATDNNKIFQTVEKFGGKAVITSSKHKSGTERIGEVASKINTDIIINVQGDEPLINPLIIKSVSEELIKNPKIDVATAKRKITEKDDLNNPNIVKVVTDKNDLALYFSRSLIPYQRKKVSGHFYKHLGIYAYRRKFLLNMPKLKDSFIEKSECLEQLKILDNGYKIKVIEVDGFSFGVDTKEDLEKIRGMIKDD